MLLHLNVLNNALQKKWTNKRAVNCWL